MVEKINVRPAAISDRKKYGNEKFICFLAGMLKMVKH